MHPKQIRSACRQVSLVVRSIHQGDGHQGVCDVLNDFWALRAAMRRLARIAKRDQDTALGVLSVNYPSLMTRVVRTFSSSEASKYHDIPELQAACKDIGGLVVALDTQYRNWSQAPYMYSRRPKPADLRPSR